MNKIFSLGDLLGEPTPINRNRPRPFCTSQSCCRHEVEGKNGKTVWAFKAYVEVEAPCGAFECKKCGYALWWTNDPEQVAS